MGFKINFLNAFRGLLIQVLITSMPVYPFIAR
jgi:hypothetical protein